MPMMAPPRKRLKRTRRKEANALVIDSDIAIEEALKQLDKVQKLASKAGLSVECQTLPRKPRQNDFG